MGDFTMKYATTIKALSTTAITAALLTGCSTTPQMNNKNKNAKISQFVMSEELNKLNRINGFRFSDWQVLSDKFMLISSTPKKKYLMELNGYCGELSFARGIMFNQTTSHDLMAKFDSISVLENPQAKCYIESFHQVNKQQIKSLTTSIRYDEK